MDQTLSRGWTRTEAENRRSAYRRLLGFNMVLQIIIGVSAVLMPRWVTSLLGLHDPVQPGWVSCWGGMVLLATLLYVPGYLEPVRHRWSNLGGIVGRLGFVMLYIALTLSGSWGFLVPALFDLAFGAGLAIMYYRLAIAELMSRP